MRIRTTIATLSILLGCWLALVTPTDARSAPLAHTRADTRGPLPTGTTHPRERAARIRAQARRRFLLRRRAWVRSLYGVDAAMFAEAQRVDNCEEGGNWHFVGSLFDGGVGWTPADWLQFRKPWWPQWMHQASPHMQANALFRFIWHYGIAMPDQGGTCYGY